MKKIISILLCVVLTVVVFAGCSSKPAKQNESTTKAKTAASTTQVITTDKAVITESNALALIRSYSAKELSINNDDYKNCDFLVSASGIQVKKDYYVKVIATVKTEHTNDAGEKTYTFDNKGEYYIRYDGKQILKKNMSSDKDEYSEMKVKEVPTTKPSTTVTEKTTK